MKKVLQIYQRIKYTSLRDWISIFYFLLALLCSFVYKRKHANLWLICDRADEARDNGYWLFKYICEKHPEQEIIFAISRTSDDYEKVARLGKVVEYGSLKHWIYYLSAKHNISSQKSGKPNAAFCYFLEVYGFWKNSRIFLQHGITLNDAKWLYYENTKFNLFICGALSEYDFVKNKFGYMENNIKYFGFARFDNLHEIKVVPKRIVIMPSWREWLTNIVNSYGNFEEVGCEFAASEYFKRWNAFLNNEALLENAKKYHLEILFYPHREMQKFLSQFTIDKRYIKLASKDEWDVQELLKSCAMLVTDYSSVFFDVVYMKKPIVFYQFDQEKFRRYQYSEGWFDYEKNSFGNCYKEEMDCVNFIVKNIKNDFQVDGEYLQMHRKIFPLYDSNNCRRIYDFIKNRM